MKLYLSTLKVLKSGTKCLPHRGEELKMGIENNDFILLYFPQHFDGSKYHDIRLKLNFTFQF